MSDIWTMRRAIVCTGRRFTVSITPAAAKADAIIRLHLPSSNQNIQEKDGMTTTFRAIKHLRESWNDYDVRLIKHHHCPVITWQRKPE